MRTEKKYKRTEGIEYKVRERAKKSMIKYESKSGHGNGKWEMGNGKQLKDNRQIYLNIPANSKPFFAVSFFVNYSFAPFCGGLRLPPPLGSPFAPRLSPFCVLFVLRPESFVLSPNGTLCKLFSQPCGKYEISEIYL